MTTQKEWIGGVLLVLFLAGCGGGVEETPLAPQAVETPLPTTTPLIPFEPTPQVIAPDPSRPTSLYLEPAVANLTVGESALINVWLDGVQQLNGISLEIAFNPNYVQIEDAEPETEGVQIIAGDIPEPDEIVRNEVIAQEGGLITYQVNQEAGTSKDGIGIVASFRLLAVVEGGTPLDFVTLEAHDVEGNEIEIDPLSSGLVTIVAGEGPAPTATVAATVVVTEEPASTPAATAEPTLVPTLAPTAESVTATVTAVPPTATAAPTVSPAPVLSPPVGEGIYYIVQPGENLFRIGIGFGTTAEAIATASNLSDPNQVQAGTLVLIPVAPSQGGYGYYVQASDTVYSIARRFGMTEEALVALNGIGADFHIGIGQILTVTP